ncbi:MAG TPA: DUF4402 domain-containing protein [Gemmatimonadales bacterium]
MSVTARLRLMVATLVLLTSAGGSAAAQSALMTASAEVSTIAISIFGSQPLDFGAVIPGAATLIDPKSGTAGIFEIRGARRAEFTLTMALPTQLTTGGGPHTMPISFGPNGGCHRNQDQQANCTYYDPSSTLVANLRAPPFPNNTYFVWIGGTVSPSPTQFPGVYTGVISASVAYTGN